MKRLSFSILLIYLFTARLFCQIDSCYLLNFESISDTFSLPIDGQSISDEFNSILGLSFSLENGEDPVIAKIGPPQTAFGSAFGQDMASPESNIGDFFLTDDGVLSGLESPPLILTFTTNIDSISACVLDIDFDENFTIELRDSLQNVVAVDTIFTGDSGTGDGLCTQWGFNTTTFEENIYSVRFIGNRTTPGAFGLGLDNFTFCARSNVSTSAKEPQAFFPSIYPNPTSGMINLTTRQKGSFVIYNSFLKVVSTGLLNLDIDTQELLPGHYFLAIKLEDGSKKHYPFIKI